MAPPIPPLLRAALPVKVHLKMLKTPLLPSCSAPPALPLAAAVLPPNMELVTPSVPVEVKRIAPAIVPETLFEKTQVSMVTLPSGLQAIPAALLKPAVVLD